MTLGACGKDGGLIAIEGGSVPTMPNPMPGEATVAGFVRDAAGSPVAGATLMIAETDVTATSDDAGAYQIAAPSDSTVTIVASAPGFGKTFEESVVLGAGAAVANFDVRLLPSAELTATNALSGVAAPEKRGVMAIRLQTSGGACSAAGATITVWPPDAGTIVYSRPSVASGLGDPDLTLGAVQDGADVAAWLVAVIPPGNMLSLTVSRSGCQSATAPTANGMSFTGALRSDAGALTEARLFLGEVQ